METETDSVGNGVWERGLEYYYRSISQAHTKSIHNGCDSCPSFTWHKKIACKHQCVRKKKFQPVNQTEIPKEIPQLPAHTGFLRLERCCNWDGAVTVATVKCAGIFFCVFTKQYCVWSGDPQPNFCSCVEKLRSQEKQGRTGETFVTGIFQC